MNEFKTAKEAKQMLHNLQKAAIYCTGENSSRQHDQRMRKVEAEYQKLKLVENLKKKSTI